MTRIRRWLGLPFAALGLVLLIAAAAVAYWCVGRRHLRHLWTQRE